jgi:hypothetical protein
MRYVFIALMILIGISTCAKGEDPEYDQYMRADNERRDNNALVTIEDAVFTLDVQLLSMDDRGEWVWNATTSHLSTIRMKLRSNGIQLWNDKDGITQYMIKVILRKTQPVTLVTVQFVRVVQIAELDGEANVYGYSNSWYSSDSYDSVITGNMITEMLDLFCDAYFTAMEKHYRH